MTLWPCGYMTESSITCMQEEHKSICISEREEEKVVTFHFLRIRLFQHDWKICQKDEKDKEEKKNAKCHILLMLE